MNEEYAVKRIVTMVCGSRIYKDIIADREVVTCKDIPLGHKIKYVYDPNVRVYYEFIEATPEMDETLGDYNIVIVNSSQFGDDPVIEADMLGSIARITNFATRVEEVKPVEEPKEETPIED